MKKITFWFVTGTGLVPQSVWVDQGIDPGELGHADFVYNAHSFASQETGRITIRMEHVAFWTYD